MAMWDSTLLAYVDRSRIIPPDYRELVIRTNGDVLPTLLVDGHVAGVWRPVDGGIEATAFHRLDGRRLGGPRGRGPRPDRLPRRPPTDRLQPLRPLVGNAPERRGPRPRPFLTHTVTFALHDGTMERRA